ncbi:MAG TPA: FAD-binding and (Fe-S)-binding domain-containing protein, partial [Puia sp.]
EEIFLLFRLARQLRVSITFRTAGTSLSGQTVTDGILVDVSKYWGAVQVEDNGAYVRVQPGVTGAVVNHHLRKYGRKIGPDPASIQSAMMGGILSNNSSGMCCGVADNSYHTLAYIKFMLANGQVFDTGRAEDYTRFEREAAGLCNGLANLRRRVMENTALVARIREKYKRKNTVGYGLNAFVDFEHPLDILSHLLIGGEGTLGFIAEAVLRTIPDKPFKSAALLFFESPRSACDAIPLLKDSGAEALEFMDRAALRSIEHLASAPAFLKALPDRASCILCEYQADSREGLEVLLDRAAQQLDSLPLISRTIFTSDEKERGNYWKLRKGMYPSVAAVRAKGTSVMLEDIAVPLDRLGETIELLQELFRKFNYAHAIVFGHAKDGNLHFVVSQSVATSDDIALFAAFNDALAELIIHRCQGALKAEHGTGRQVAPYVEDEWGSEAYQVMKELKALVDPDNIVNPGVILNDDRHCHLKNLKSLPIVEEEVDKCVECGYCELSCPSRNFTLTPRQRIVLRRSLARLKASGDDRTHEAILKDYQHDGMDTCAVDGMCATNCPVDINTGELIKRLRRENHSPRANFLALQVAKRFRLTEWLVKSALNGGQLINTLFGARAMSKITVGMRKVIPSFPLWMSEMTGPVAVQVYRPAAPGAVYFPTCLTRMMGRDKDGKASIAEVLLRLSDKAGIGLVIPPGVNGSCCGQAFSSKGFADAYRFTVNQTVDKLWEWSHQGALPVVIDISSCSHSLHTCRPYLTPDNQLRFDKLKLMDSLEFAVDILIPRLSIRKKAGKAVFHPVCSLHKMNLYKKLEELAARTVEEPVIPFTAGCCGMAGDRGFYYPGLIASACRDEGSEAATQAASGYYSTARTCEMALSETSGKTYRSILYLLDEVSADGR